MQAVGRTTYAFAHLHTALTKWKVKIKNDYCVKKGYRADKQIGIEHTLSMLKNNTFYESRAFHF